MNSPMIATTTTAAASRHGCLRRTTAYVAEPETAWVSAATGAMPVVTGVPPAAGRSRLCRTLWQPLVDGGLRQPLALQPERLQDLGVLAVLDQLVDGEDDDVLELLAEGAVLEHDAVVGREVGGPIRTNLPGVVSIKLSTISGPATATCARPSLISSTPVGGPRRVSRS